MAKPQQTISEIVESHKPKNFKYYYDFHEDAMLVNWNNKDLIYQQLIQLRIPN